MVIFTTALAAKSAMVCTCKTDLVYYVISLCTVCQIKQKRIHKQKKSQISKHPEYSDTLTLCMLGNFACFLSSVDFFLN